MTGLQACNRVRNLSQTLPRPRPDSFSRASLPNTRQPRLRLPFRRQAHTTPSSCLSLYRAKRDQRRCALFHTPSLRSNGLNLKPDDKHKHAGKHAYPVEEDVSTRLLFRPVNIEENAGDKRDSTQSESKSNLRSGETSLLKILALDKWVSLKHQEGWRFAWATTPVDENDKTGASWCDIDIQHLPTKSQWKTSSKHLSPLQAKQEASETLLIKLCKTFDWTNLSKEPDDIKFLQLVFTNRLTLQPISRNSQVTVYANAPGSIKSFEAKLRRGETLKSINLMTLVNQLIPKMQQDGIWYHLLEIAPQELTPESLSQTPEQPALEPTEQKILDSTDKEPVPETSEQSSQDFAEQGPTMLIEKAILAGFETTERSRRMFYNLMARGRFGLKAQASPEGLKTCWATYKEPSVQLEVTIRAGSSEKTTRSQLERRATALLMSKLRSYKLLAVELETSAIWPECRLSLNDDMIWGMRSTTDQLLKAKDAVYLPGPEKDSSSPEHQKSEISDSAAFDVQRRSQQLSALLENQRKSEDPKIVAIQSLRAQLPVFQIRNQVLELVNANTYSLVSAETGSGKSTQVPQIILDEAIDRRAGGDCNIICVQPRRIAAQLLAERVAEERNERIGLTVGSEVRFDRRQADHRGGTITYCTTGVMLNYLQNNPTKLDSLTHIILDEVHVRDLNIDFVMLLLKRYVDRCRAAGIREPRVVIMSATVDTDLFTSYFRNTGPDGTLIPAPHISITGRQHHVKQHYLTEIFDSLKTTLDPKLLSTLLDEPETKQFLIEHFEQFGESENATAENPNFLVEAPSETKLRTQDEYLPSGLISALVFHILAATESGSIMIFLPGLAWIENLTDQLKTFARRPEVGLDFANDNLFRILQLHADLPEEMAKLSLPVPKGCRRILLSTEVAEASVTLPDVKYVIDTGKVNQMTYNSETHTRRLDCTWASRSSAIQRQGRAGRVHDGEYFFIGTKKCYDYLRPTKAAGIQREDLGAVCLRAKNIAPDVPTPELLQQCIEPPDNDKVRHTIETLKVLGALDKNETITNLGALLSNISLSPISAKMAILGAMFRCLDPMLIVALAENGRGLFHFGTIDRESAQKSRASFAGATLSDHFAEINAFKSVRKKWTEEGENEAYLYADSKRINFRSYKENSKVASLIIDALSRARLVPASAKLLTKKQFGGPSYNINSDNNALIKALIAHCLSTQTAAPKFYSKYFFYTPTESSLFLRSASAAKTNENLPPRQVVVYSKKHGRLPNPQASMSEISPVSPLATSLLGGRLLWNKETLRLNDWLLLGVDIEKGAFSGDEAMQIFFEFRKALDKSLTTAYASLNAKSTNPHERERIEQSRDKYLETLQEVLSHTFEQDNGYSIQHTHPERWNAHSIRNYKAFWEEEEAREAMEIERESVQ